MEKRKNKEDHLLILESFVEEIKNEWKQKGIILDHRKASLNKDNGIVLYVLNKGKNRREQKVTITTKEEKNCCRVLIDAGPGSPCFSFYTTLDTMGEDTETMKKYLYFSPPKPAS